MIASTFTIPDGTTLTQARDRDGRRFGVDPVTKRTCTYEGDQAAGRLVDSAGELVREIVPGSRQCGRGPPRPAASSSTDTAKPTPRRSPDRWVAFNGFVDVIAPRLSLAERAVWMLMFRHARGWVCETSVRFVAQGAAVSKSTAESALATLHRAGLVWVIAKSRHKGQGSSYGIHPDPAACLPRLVENGEPSRPSGRLGNRTVPIGAFNRPDHRDKYRKQKGDGGPSACRQPAGDATKAAKPQSRNGGVAPPPHPARPGGADTAANGAPPHA